MAQLSNDNCDECHKEEAEVVNDCVTGRPDLLILLGTRFGGVGMDEERLSLGNEV